MLLTLPDISADIPAVMDFGTHGERHLRLALAMNRVGMVEQVQLGSLRPARFNSKALSHLIESNWMREVAPLFDFKVISAHATLTIPTDDNEEWENTKNQPMCGVIINANAPEWIAVGKTMEALEKAKPGLGRKALDILDHVLSWFCMPFTPGGAYQMAQMLYWEGENDEKGVLERYAAEGEDTSDVWKRDELFDGVPDWAYDYQAKKPKKLDDSAFARIAKKMATGPYGPLLSCLARLNTLLSQDKRDLRCSPPDEYQCTEPMVVLHWNEVDDLNRVFDDFWQFESQGEQSPWMGSISFALTEEDLTNALVRVRHTGHMLKALDDSLVALLDLTKDKR